MSNYSYGTLGGNTHTITLTPSVGDERPRTPAGLIVTRAVETRDGWLGQVLVDKEIVFEGDPISGEDAADHAIQEANKRVVSAIKGLFADSAPEHETRES